MDVKLCDAPESSKISFSCLAIFSMMCNNKLAVVITSTLLKAEQPIT